MTLSNDACTQFWAEARAAVSRGTLSQALVDGLAQNTKKSGAKYWGTTLAKLRAAIREAEQGHPTQLPDWRDRARAVGLEHDFIAWVLYQRTAEGPVQRKDNGLYKICGTKQQATDAVAVLEDRGLIAVTRDHWGIKEVSRAAG